MRNLAFARFSLLSGGLRVHSFRGFRVFLLLFSRFSRCLPFSYVFVVFAVSFSAVFAVFVVFAVFGCKIRLAHVTKTNRTVSLCWSSRREINRASCAARMQKNKAGHGTSISVESAMTVIWFTLRWPRGASGWQTFSTTCDSS